MKGQAAIEYLGLIGFLLLISIPLVIQAQQSATELQESTDQLKVSNMMDTVEEAMTLVYGQGEPARIRFTVDVPPGVTNATVENQIVIVRFEGDQGASDYIRTFPFNVTGTLPTERGRHTMVAEAVGRTNVTIYEQ